MEFKFKHYGEEYTGRLTFGHYAYGGNIYIGVESFDPEYEVWEPWCDLTTNLSGMYYTANTISIECGGAEYEKPLPTILKELGIITKKTLSKVPYNFATFDFYTVNLDKLKEVAIEIK